MKFSYKIMDRIPQYQVHELQKLAEAIRQADRIIRLMNQKRK